MDSVLLAEYPEDIQWIKNNNIKSNFEKDTSYSTEKSSLFNQYLIGTFAYPEGPPFQWTLYKISSNGIDYLLVFYEGYYSYYPSFLLFSTKQIFLNRIDFLGREVVFDQISVGDFETAFLVKEYDKSMAYDVSELSIFIIHQNEFKQVFNEGLIFDNYSDYGNQWNLTDNQSYRVENNIILPDDYSKPITVQSTEMIALFSDEKHQPVKILNRDTTTYLWNDEVLIFEKK